MVMARRITLRSEPIRVPKKRRKATNSAKSSDKERLNLQINAELKRRTQRYAEKNGTTLTDIISEHFTALLDDQEKTVLDLGAVLRDWLTVYAAEHHTSPEQVIIDLLVQLRKKERGDGVEQI